MDVRLRAVEFGGVWHWHVTEGCARCRPAPDRGRGDQAPCGAAAQRGAGAGAQVAAGAGARLLDPRAIRRLATFWPAPRIAGALRRERRGRHGSRRSRRKVRLMRSPFDARLPGHAVDVVPLAGPAHHEQGAVAELESCRPWSLRRRGLTTRRRVGAEGDDGHQRVGPQLRLVIGVQPHAVITVAVPIQQDVVEHAAGLGARPARGARSSWA